MKELGGGDGRKHSLIPMEPIWESKFGADGESGRETRHQPRCGGMGSNHESSGECTE